MAQCYFARYDSTNVVREVICVHSSNAATEAKGIAWLEKNFKRDTAGTWIQTWKNDADVPEGITRRGFAGLGNEYDPSTQSFKPIKIYSSWVYDSTNNEWKAPVDAPADMGTGHDNGYVIGNLDRCYDWDEENTQWVNIATRPAPHTDPADPDPINPSTQWEWDESSQRWRYFDSGSSSWVVDSREY